MPIFPPVDYKMSWNDQVITYLKYMSTMGTASTYTKVTNFTNLPPAADYSNQIFVVLETTYYINIPPLVIINKPAGLYYSTGTDWNWLGANATVFADNLLRIVNGLDNTKEVAFDVSAVSTGVTRTITMPDHDVSLASLENTWGSITGNISSQTDLQESLKQMNAGPITRPTVTFGSGTFSISSCDAYIFPNSDSSGNIGKWTIPALNNQSIADNVYYYVYIDYNSGNPIYKYTTDSLLLNNASQLGIAQLVHEIPPGGAIDEYKVFYNGEYGLGLTNKLALRAIRTQRFAWESGLTIAAGGSQNITTTTGTFWFDGQRVTLNPTNSLTGPYHFYYHVAGVWNAAEITTFNNSEYDNGTNLATLTNNRYTVNWVYIDITQNDYDAYVVLGNGDFNTIALAAASAPPTVLPTIIQRSGLLVGRLIVQKGATIPAQTDSAFTVTFSGAATTDHNNLNGLQGGTINEYYHLTNAQYGLINRTNAITVTGNTNITSAYIKYISNGTNLVHTLPSAATADGNTWEIVNINSTPLTLTGTINGVVNPLLYQYETLSLISDGSNFYAG